MHQTVLHYYACPCRGELCYLKKINEYRDKFDFGQIWVFRNFPRTAKKCFDVLTALVFLWQQRFNTGWKTETENIWWNWTRWVMVVMTSQLYLSWNQCEEKMLTSQTPVWHCQAPVEGACTHPVVEWVLRSGHAAVDHAPCWRDEGSAEGCRGRARRWHLAIHGCRPYLSLLQREGRVRNPAHVDLFPSGTNIWITERKYMVKNGSGSVWVREHMDSRENLWIEIEL